MTLETLLGIVLGGIFGGLIGGGAIAGLFYRALKDRLREDLGKDFASRAELDGVGGRVSGVLSIATMTKETADANGDRITRLEEATNAERHALSRTLERIDRHLSQFEERQRTVEGQAERTATMLLELEKRMDRHAPHD